MGEYGAFVWSAYAIAAIVVAALGAWTALDYRAQRRALERLENEAAAARRGTGMPGLG